MKTQIQVDIDNIATDLNRVEKVVAQGDNYIRYSSGKQIIFDGLSASTSGVKYTFPKAFSHDPVITMSQASPSVSYLTELSAVHVSIANTTTGVYTRFIAIGKWK